MSAETEIERMLKTGIYQIYNKLNGKRYVGSTTKSFKGRWAGHRNALRRGLHCNRHLQSAWSKYGERSFAFSIIEKCLPESCIRREQYWIDKLSCCFNSKGYNGRPTAENNLGMKFGPHSKEHKAKIAKSVKETGYGPPRLTEASKKKIGDTQRGKPKSEAFKENLRKARTGWKFSEETIAKMRVSAKKRGISQETRDKINTTIRTKEHHIKASESAKRRGISPETRIKISMSLRGNVPSIETRKKISEASKRQWARYRGEL